MCSVCVHVCMCVHTHTHTLYIHILHDYIHICTHTHTLRHTTHKQLNIHVFTNTLHPQDGQFDLVFCGTGSPDGSFGLMSSPMQAPVRLVHAHAYVCVFHIHSYVCASAGTIVCMWRAYMRVYFIHSQHIRMPMPRYLVQCMLCFLCVSAECFS